MCACVKMVMQLIMCYCSQPGWLCDKPRTFCQSMHTSASVIFPVHSGAFGLHVGTIKVQSRYNQV